MVLLSGNVELLLGNLDISCSFTKFSYLSILLRMVQLYGIRNSAKPLQNLTCSIVLFQDTMVTAINSKIALNIKDSHQKCTFYNVRTALHVQIT
jgi:hypothetical protein